jgi:three-Cys-motif partner protein
VYIGENMPVDEHNVGWNPEFTPRKQTGFGAILGYQLSVCRGIFQNPLRSKYIYTYIDINAAYGYYPSMKLDGSPLIFLKRAEKYGIPYKAYFIEEELDNCEKLTTNIGDLAPGKWQLYNDKYENVLPDLCRKIRDSYGMLYHDPNNIPSFDILSYVYRNNNLYFVDCLISTSATIIKRVKNGCGGKSLVDYLKTINKKFWLIRDLDKSDKHQWTLLFGTNWDGFKNYEKQGFYRIDSSKGRDILRRCNMTADELKEYELTCGQQTLEMVL